MNYAMIPINRRYDEKGNRIVRRVLISFNYIEWGQYKGTKLIAKDPYFNNPNSSQQYVFEDTEFWLIKDGYSDDIQSTLLNVKRPYEWDAHRLVEKAIEFIADSDEEAIEIFNNREELH